MKFIKLSPLRKLFKSNASSAAFRARIQELQKRAAGAIAFLKKTEIPRQSQSISLNVLPWWLVLGNRESGKTALLAAADVNYILQKRPVTQSANDNCDWWVTRDITLVDVPGYYLEKKMQRLWLYFLNFIKKNRSKDGLQGILLTIPLSDLLENKFDLESALTDLQRVIPRALFCSIIITKCDQLPGFNAFFAELSIEESRQVWGITLHGKQNACQVFSARFNQLIKKINDQLLSRLHQERDQETKFYIKEFPLQLEKVKGNLLALLKKIQSCNPLLQIQAINLTSALQPPPTSQLYAAHEQQIQSLPINKSQPYFIKQLLSQSLVQTQLANPKPISHWRDFFAYGCAALLIASSGWWLYKDFSIAMKIATVDQSYITKFVSEKKPTTTTIAQLQAALPLLNHLATPAKKIFIPINIYRLLTHYSDSALRNREAAYHHALQKILLPTITVALGDALTQFNPQSPHQTYAVLGGYLALAYPHHANDLTMIENALSLSIKPQLSNLEWTWLLTHLKLLLAEKIAITLDNSKIAFARHALKQLPLATLTRVILHQKIDPTWLTLNAPFILQTNLAQVSTIYLKDNYLKIKSQLLQDAITEATKGNWILGMPLHPEIDAQAATAAANKVAADYRAEFIATWESVIQQLTLSKPDNLVELNQQLIGLNNSTTAWPAIINIILNETNIEEVLIQSSLLKNLHSYSNATTFTALQTCMQQLQKQLQSIINTNQPDAAVFDFLVNRVQGNSTASAALATLEKIEKTSPLPIKIWLEQIDETAKKEILSKATAWIEFNWSKFITTYYHSSIENHYPFLSSSKDDVALNSFVKFFGSDGQMLAFYTHYLKPFISEENDKWSWKTIDEMQLPLNGKIFKQIQFAQKINQVFFPNHDNQLAVNFSLRAYQLSKQINQVSIHINDKTYTDDHSGYTPTHTITWPTVYAAREQKTQLIIQEAHRHPLMQIIEGDWSWLRLISQSTETSLAKNILLLNFSLSDKSAKYILTTDENSPAFFSLALSQFHLPEHLS